VITSNVSCLPEAGGPGAFYVNPYQPEQIAKQLQFILHHPEEVKNKIELGTQHANLFTIEKTAAAVMNVYNQLIG
jgi:glycosyltransferase involved in cell wall biosynthesis